MNKDLYISDISFDATEEDLYKLFSVIGTVKSVHLITDKQSGQFKGCAFVKMSSEAEAKAAINTLDGTRLINRIISVSAARPKPTPGATSALPQDEPAKSKRPPRHKKPRRR